MKFSRYFACPSAEPSQFWLELSRKVENGDLTKSSIFEEVENVDGRETKRHGVVKLVVGTGRKTSTGGAISGFSKFIKLNGGVITLNTTPVGIYGSGDKRSVHLLPVEMLVPKLNDKLEAVKDSDGKDRLVDPGELRFCKWRDAFPADSWKVGSHQFDTDFIERDRDRVVIRI